MNLVKSILKGLAIVAFVMVSTFQVQAQGQGKGKGKPEGKGRPEHSQKNMNPEDGAAKFADKLTKELSLSADQTAQVKAIALKYGPQNRSAMSSAEDKKAKMDEMKANRAAQDQEIAAILTPEQLTKWNTMKDNAKEHAEGEHGKGMSQGKGKGQGKDKAKAKGTKAGN